MPWRRSTPRDGVTIYGSQSSERRCALARPRSTPSPSTSSVQTWLNAICTVLCGRPSLVPVACCLRASIGPLDPGVYRVALELGLADGTSLTAATENVVVGVRLPPTPVDLPGARVAVVMATHNPPPELFERQIESIRAQQDVSWCCLVCDDASSSEHVERDAQRAGQRQALRADRERAAGRLLPELRASTPARACVCAVRGPLGSGRRVASSQAATPVRRAGQRPRDAVGRQRRSGGRRLRTRHGADVLRSPPTDTRQSVQPLRGQQPDRRLDALPARVARPCPAIPPGISQPIPRPLARPVSAHRRNGGLRGRTPARLHPAWRQHLRQPRERAVAARSGDEGDPATRDRRRRAAIGLVEILRRHASRSVGRSKAPQGEVARPTQRSPGSTG